MERLSKNFIWMAAANITSSLFGITLFIYLARILMPGAMGQLSYAFTLIFFAANFIDLGMATFGIREIAKDRARMPDYVSEIISFRLILACILTAVLFVIVSFSPWPRLLRLVIIESSLMLFMLALATEWAFQGVENMPLVFVSLSVTGALQLGSIYLFVKGPEDLLKAPILYAMSALPMVVIFLRKLKFRFHFSPAIFRKIAGYMPSSLTIWAISLFAQIYNTFDLFLLGIVRSIQDVGYFAIARRFVGGVALLVVYLANGALPRLSSSFLEDRAQFGRVVGKFRMTTIFIVIFALLPVIVLSDFLISSIFGAEYLPASLQLRLMIIGIIFVLFNLPYSTALVACGMERQVLKQALASAVLNVSANLILIPRYGMTGASISFIMAEAMAFVWIRTVYRRKFVLI